MRRGAVRRTGRYGKMEIVVFVCEESIEGILTGVYDAWVEALSSDRKSVV